MSAFIGLGVSCQAAPHAAAPGKSDTTVGPLHFHTTTNLSPDGENVLQRVTISNGGDTVVRFTVEDLCLNAISYDSPGRSGPGFGDPAHPPGGACALTGYGVSLTPDSAFSFSGRTPLSRVFPDSARAGTYYFNAFLLLDNLTLRVPAGSATLRR